MPSPLEFSSADPTLEKTEGERYARTCGSLTECVSTAGHLCVRLLSVEPEERPLRFNHCALDIVAAPDPSEM